MTKNKTVYVLLIVLCIIASLYIGIFAYKNFRGVRPAIAPPAKNITKEYNTTGFPLTLPEGFSISIFAKGLSDPRVLSFDPNRSLLTSIPSEGKIVALLDKNQDGQADDVIDVITNLNKPHGIAFHPTTKKLYIAETDQVDVYDYDGVSFNATNKKKIVDLPGGGNHFSRTIGFSPEGRLYISVGSSCNACVEKDWRRAKILVANADGSDLKEYATGLRNSVFFTWHPVTRELWATEMGRDLIGDDIPPDEINIIKDGSDFGWPYCYSNNVVDLSFDRSENARRKCKSAVPSYIEIPAHSAPLGLAFVPNVFEQKGLNKLPTGNTIRPFESWPIEYRNNLLVAYHGSWNRSVPTGYKVVRIKLDEKGNYLGVEDFITGWLENASSSAGALGRPVDLLFDNNRNLYISDDKAGVIYKISHQ